MLFRSGAHHTLALGFEVRVIPFSEPVKSTTTESHPLFFTYKSEMLRCLFSVNTALTGISPRITDRSHSLLAFTLLLLMGALTGNVSGAEKAIAATGR